MIRQYRSQTTVLPRPLAGDHATSLRREFRCGPVPVGTIVYIQDGLTPFGPRDPRFFSPVRRAPYVVEAWHNREYHTCTKRGTVAMAGGHLATVRNLRDGRRSLAADWLIAMSLELA